MKQLLDIEINLYQEENKKVFHLGATTKGFLKIRAKENINVQELGIHLIKVTTGQKDEIVFTQAIFNEDTLSKNEIYRFPINFVNSNHESYHGKKLQITFKLKPYLLTKESGNIKDKTEAYIIHFLEKDTVWATKPYLDFASKHSKYTIPPQETVLTHNSCLAVIVYSLLFLWFTFFLLGATMKQQNSADLLINLYLIGLGIIIFVNQYISNFVLGKIHLEIEETRDRNFTIYVGKEKKWQGIHRITAYFEIEEVNHGQRNSKDRMFHSIYKSQVYKLKPPYEDLKLSFKLPRFVPASLKTKDFQIKWSLKLKLATTSGLNYDFSWDFLVDKDYSANE